MAGVADDDDVGHKSTNTNESKEATKCLRTTPFGTFQPEENNKIVTGCVIMFQVRVLPSVQKLCQASVLILVERRDSEFSSFD